MNDHRGTFEQFLLWERASWDTLEVKRLYIDMAGDLVAGVVLSQIVYWHLPSREGKARLQVEKEGELWLAKGRAEWWEECRISPKQADRALDLLQSKGLIEVRLFKFGKAPVKHIRIRRDDFLRAWKAELEKQPDGSEPPDGEQGSGPDFTQRSNSIFTKGQNRISPKGKIDLPQRVKSLDTETTTETTAAAATDADRPAKHAGSELAAAGLLKELVSQGMGRSVAERFAREKPAVCRRCLQYLPYAKVRTSKGAWLADAIRNEYGPPEGYLKAQEDERKAKVQKGRLSRKDARSNEMKARVRAWYASMEQERGEAHSAFNAYVERERERAARIADHLSPARKEQLLAAYDEPERRLELFEQWLATKPQQGNGEPRDGPSRTRALALSEAVEARPP